MSEHLSRVLENQLDERPEEGAGFHRWLPQGSGGSRKKAFKQAIGGLYRKRRILIQDGGIRLADATEP